MHKVFSILLNAIKLWLLLAKCPAPTILQWNGTTLASQQRENGRGTLSSFQTKLVWRFVSQLSISNSQFNFIGRVVSGNDYRLWLEGQLGPWRHVHTWSLARQPHWSTCSMFFIHFFCSSNCCFWSNPCLPPSPLFILALPAQDNRTPEREAEDTPPDSNVWKLRYLGHFLRPWGCMEMGKLNSMVNH